MDRDVKRERLKVQGRRGKDEGGGRENFSRKRGVENVSDLLCVES